MPESEIGWHVTLGGVSRINMTSSPASLTPSIPEPNFSIHSSYNTSSCAARHFLCCFISLLLSICFQSVLYSYLVKAVHITWDISVYKSIGRDIGRLFSRQTQTQSHTDTETCDLTARFFHSHKLDFVKLMTEL